jgi:hypothetical protein
MLPICVPSLLCTFSRVCSLQWQCLLSQGRQGAENQWMSDLQLQAEPALLCFVLLQVLCRVWPPAAEGG